jgi:hypothetical protein
MRQQWLLIPAFLATIVPAVANCADRIILRNLDIITDRTVTALDEDGLQLDAPRTGASSKLTWDEIERGKIALDQARFDALLSDLGPPLYRLRQRLKTGDYAAASQPAEMLYPRFVGRSSQTAYLVCQATMWSRLAAGKRESAVEPYLRCYELLRSRAAVTRALPGSRRVKLDAATAMTPELAPVWFDATAAKQALPLVEQLIRTIPQPRPSSAYVYYATLAVAAGDSAEAERVLPLLEAATGVEIWPTLIRAEQELASGSSGQAIQQLHSKREALPPAARPAALLMLGLADSQSTDEDVCRSGLIDLLSLPAIYGSEQPELAAAGLYHAAQALDKLKDASGAAAVRRELTSRYADTHFGAMAR